MKNPSRLPLALLALIALLSSRNTLALDLLPDFDLFGGGDEEGQVIWQGGDQFIKIVPREEARGGPLHPNQHPVQIGLEQMKEVLQSLQLRTKSALFSDETERTPLFTHSEIAVLSSGLARALARAKPEEDVIFKVMGMHKGLIAKERMFMAGRVFYQGNRLHFIFGDLYKPVSGDRSEKAKNLAAGCGDCPVTAAATRARPGSRFKEHELDSPFARVEGLELQRQGGKIRSDWVVIDVPKMIAAIEREKNRLPPQLEQARQKSRLEAQRLNLERRQMREEMARLRKQIREMEKKGGASARTIEERLTTLDQLKKKGLITDQEYQRRRREILSNI